MGKEDEWRWKGETSKIFWIQFAYNVLENDENMENNNTFGSFMEYKGTSIDTSIRLKSFIKQQ